MHGKPATDPVISGRDMSNEFQAAYVSYADYGGPLVHTREFVKAFRKLNHSLTVHAPFLKKDVPYGGHRKTRTFFNAVFAHLPAACRRLKLEFYQLRKLARDWMKWRHFRDLYRNNRVDIVVIRMDAFVMGASYAARKCRIPYIVEINGVLSEDYPDRVTNRFEKCLLSEAAGIFTVVPELKDMYIARGVQENKIRVVTNGVCVEDFTAPDPAVVAESLRSTLHDRIVVGYLGTFAAYQSLSSVIDGFRNALAEIPSLHLLLIGDGQATPEIRDRLSGTATADRVTFTGRIPYGHVPAYLSLCHIAVNPMRRIYREGFHCAPIKMFEYMAAGLPIISSDLPSLRRILADAAVFVEQNSPEDWHKMLVKLAGDEAFRRRKGDESLQRLHECGFTWENNAQKVYEFCRDILAGKS